MFIYAGAGKMMHTAQFADDVAAFRILPIPSVNLFAIVLPWVELLAGVALLVGAGVRSGGLLILGLNVMFLAAIFSALARGLDIHCGCFTLSRAHEKVGWSLAGRDLALLMLCLPIVLHPDRKASAGKAVAPGGNS